MRALGVRPAGLAAAAALLLLLPPPGSGDADVCSYADARAWLHHCELADDCTSDAGFCSCCSVHRTYDYGEACAAICPDAPTEPADGFTFDEFGGGTDPLVGPYFDQPALSLVGDAERKVKSPASTAGRTSTRDVRQTVFAAGPSETNTHIRR